MPFQSEKQRRYLHANHPEIAKRWEKEYATGGISNHFRKKYSLGEGPVMEDTESTDFISSLTQEQIDDDPERYAQLLIGLRKPDFFMGEGDNQRAYFIQSDNSRISVPWGFRGYGLSYDPTIDFKKGGIANHFKFKNGGNATKKIKGQPHMLAYITPNEANKLVALGGQETMTDEGIPAYPEWDNYGQTKSEFEGSSPSSVGGGDQEDDVAKMEKDMGVTTDHSPHYTGSDAGWVVSEDEETEIGGADYIGPKDQVRIQKEIINRKNKFDSNWEKIKRAGSVMSSFMSITNPLGFAKFVYDQNKKKNERIAEIDADLALLDKIGATKFTPHTDTIYQTLEQEKLDLTQPRSNKDEDTGGDGPPTPLVVPEVMDEMADATGQIDMFDAWSNIKQKQALRAGLFADEDQAKVGEWVGDQRLFVNSGGLANLFRVKNQ
jgi:hypothetical protein